MAATEIFNRRSQRSVPVALFVIAIVLLVARFTYPEEEGNKRSLVRWVKPDVAVARAQATDKPIMYDFTAEWCLPCDQLDAEVYADPRVAEEINERFISVRVTDRQQEEGKNSPEVAALEQRYSVRGFPTVIFTDATGSELGRMEGYKGRAELVRIMERVR